MYKTPPHNATKKRNKEISNTWFHLSEPSEFAYLENDAHCPALRLFHASPVQIHTHSNYPSLQRYLYTRTKRLYIKEKEKDVISRRPSFLPLQPLDRIHTSLNSHAKPSIKNEALPLGDLFQMQLRLVRLLTTERLDGVRLLFDTRSNRWRLLLAAFHSGSRTGRSRRRRRCWPRVRIADLHPCHSGHFVMRSSLAIIITSRAFEENSRQTS